MNIVKTNNYKILLVDDEQDILDILNYNLSKEGYNIICAENGVDALNKMSSDINLIILKNELNELINAGLNLSSALRS